MNSSKNKLYSKKKTGFLGQCQTQPKSLNTTIPTILSQLVHVKRVVK